MAPRRTGHIVRAQPTRGFAEDLADFLAALRRIDAAGGPQPGIHNWFRGATLRTYDATARGALGSSTITSTSPWLLPHGTSALGARWDGVDVWFHGDLAAGNLLLERGRLSAVIDFGTCGVGDPSCDLAIAWTLLDRPGRQLLRERLDIDASTWARGRGWASVEDVAQPRQRPGSPGRALGNRGAPGRRGHPRRPQGRHLTGADKRPSTRSSSVPRHHQLVHQGDQQVGAGQHPDRLAVVDDQDRVALLQLVAGGG